MDLELKDIAINLVTSTVMLILAVSIVLIWKKLTRGMLRWVGVGCLAWIVSVTVKSAIALLANEKLFELLKNAFGDSGYVIIGSLWLGILTGFTEIPIGFWIAKNRNYHTDKQGGGYGLGFGVAEAGFMAVVFAVLVLTEVFVPGNLPNDVLKIIRNVSWDNVAIANIERVFAMLIHVATGMLIVYSIAAKRIATYWIAVAYKLTVDGVAGALHLTGIVDKWSPWLIETIILPFAVLGAIIIIFVREKWPQAVSES